ncbi:RNA-directed DNA polymerase, eukaryota, Reverse transcriptase zinc-binding domain protein [Artemisia annua]|uniref:RNA-directed DNA polymerase, eukaryota, Reverse transcriptase zinc-binding domain protein n=1 Tax=Artemisia annua TaxID=35608 RepID=A0A2U1MY91_ARTAN|nr:RNA-directed DNA polymerase, eukaryota, Reverse transcriptase zinc-binding domain protein [Artemisia annua]
MNRCAAGMAIMMQTLGRLVMWESGVKVILCKSSLVGSCSKITIAAGRLDVVDVWFPIQNSYDHYWKLGFNPIVWLQVRVLLGMDVVPPSLDDALTFLIPMSKGRSVISIISRLLLGATTYYIWMERNSRLFKRKKSTVAELVQVIISTVWLKLVTFKFKKLTHRSPLLLDQWKIPSCLIHEGSAG